MTIPTLCRFDYGTGETSSKKVLIPDWEKKRLELRLSDGFITIGIIGKMP
jgi:hypothetical protein